VAVTHPGRRRERARHDLQRQRGIEQLVLGLDELGDERHVGETRARMVPSRRIVDPYYFVA
jgi:hypothetical protein